MTLFRLVLVPLAFVVRDSWARPVPYYPGLRDVPTVQAEYEYQPAQRQMPTLKEKTYPLTVTFLPSSDGRNQLWLDTDLGSYPPRWGLSEPASRVRTSSDKHSLVEALSEVTGDQFSGGCGQFDPNRAAIDQALAWLVPGGRLDSNLYGDVLLSYSGESPLPPKSVSLDAANAMATPQRLTKVASRWGCACHDLARLSFGFPLVVPPSRWAK